MPSTTNELLVDGSEQKFIGNEGIPGDDVYTVAMWWEGEHMCALGVHTSGAFPIMRSRRYLQAGSGGKFGELVVERVVEGLTSKVIYTRRN